MAAVLAGLRDWLGRVDPDEVADRLRARTWAQVRPEPVAPLAQSAAAAALTADTVLRLRRRLRCALREAPDGRVALIAGRRTHSFPADAAPGADRAARGRRAQGGRPARAGRRPIG